MTKIKKIFLVLGIAISVLTVPAFAATVSVTDASGFLDALTNNEVNKIVIDGSVEINADGNGDNALVIDRELTITGGSLSLRRGGIVLGADVTFENISLSFINLVRNGIFANGNTLTLNNVANGNSNSTSIHLFCGGITDYNGTNSLPIVANEGQINISGNNNLGNIFAGSLSDIDNGTNDYIGDSTIIINQDMTGTIGNIYAHGANESRGEGSGDILYPDSEKFVVSGDVKIYLNKLKSINLDGDTGRGGAKLIYNNSDMSICMPILKSVNEIEVKAGHLAPQTSSSFYDDNAKVSVSNDARVELVNFGEELTISEFVGGGELVLGQNQTLIVTGNVTGNTLVGIGSVFNNMSQQVPVEGYTYIKAPNANKQLYEFTLIPYTTEILELDNEGNWYVTFPDDSIVVIDATIADTIILSSGSTSASILISVTYKTDDWYNNMLCYIPVDISINDSTLSMTGNEEDGFEYLMEQNIGIASGYFTYDDTDKLILIGSGENNIIPDGTYDISIVIPKEYMKNSEDKILTTQLIVKDENILIDIEIPSANNSLIYNGEEQVGVEEGQGYSLEGHKATNAGDYQAIAKLIQGYCWNDTTTEDKTINWEINKADGIASVTLADWESDKVANNPVVSSETNGVENVTYYYKVYEAEDATYTENIPTEIGKYTLKAVFAETENYNEVIVYVDFNIVQPHTHIGGEANCMSPAICEICYSPYEEKDMTKHIGGTEIRNAIAATTSKKGYTGDKYCKGCNTLISIGKEIPKKVSSSGGGGGGGGSSAKPEEIIIKSDATNKNIIANPTATIKDKQAKTEITKTIGKEIVKQVVKNESELVLVEPIIKKEVNNVEVSILTDTLQSINNETNADLAIITSLGNIVIGNEELKKLASQGKEVSIGIKNKENKIDIEIKCDDKNLINIDGDIKVTIPYEECDLETVVVKLNTDGTKKVLAKTITNLETSEIEFYINGTVAFEIIQNSKEYEDIDKNEWYCSAIKFTSARNLFAGTTDKLFSPELTMSRAMIAQVLYNLENNPEHSIKSEFSDVLDNMWYAKAINWAVNEGIISGYGNGLYGPNDTLTREQLAVMLWKYCGKPESNHELKHFSDAEKVSEYAIKAIRWANEKGIINGDDKGKLNPMANATRAQVAQIFKNFIEKML